MQQLHMDSCYVLFFKINRLSVLFLSTEERVEMIVNDYQQNVTDETDKTGLKKQISVFH